MRNEKHLLQHFSREEAGFVEKIIDLCQQVEDTYSYRLTAFLNPRQEEIVHSVSSYFQLSAFSSRQFVQTEFSRVIIAPDYCQLDVADFEIRALEILYPRKYYQLTHAQVLGTLLNQLGMKRQLLGDILITDEQAVVFLDAKFAQLAQSDVSKMSQVPIKWVEKDWTNLVKVEQESGVTREVLLSSLRLDKVVATAFRLSRSNATKLIAAKSVKVDYVEVQQVDKLVEMGQLVSVRGFGRVRMKEQLGYSKQGKHKVEIEIIRK